MEISLRGKDQLGLALRRFRRSYRLTQQQLSAQAVMDQAMISKIETGARTPELSTLFHLCSVLGIELILRTRPSRMPPTE